MTTTIEDEKLKELTSLFGKRGGMATKKKYGPEYYKKIGTYAAQVRWGKKKFSEIT